MSHRPWDRVMESPRGLSQSPVGGWSISDAGLMRRLLLMGRDGRGHGGGRGEGRKGTGLQVRLTWMQTIAF